MSDSSDVPAARWAKQLYVAPARPAPAPPADAATATHRVKHRLTARAKRLAIFSH